MHIQIVILLTFLTNANAGQLLTRSIGLDYYNKYRRIGNRGGLVNNNIYGGPGRQLNEGYGHIGLRGTLSNDYERIELGNGFENNREYVQIGERFRQKYGNIGYEGGVNPKYVEETYNYEISSPNYEYGYGVYDPKTGDYKKQTESRVNGLTKSEYILKENDRNVQVYREISKAIPVKIFKNY